ncbi:MAG TPA: formyltransferase family protein [Gemmatimonadaceae bacterium]
MPEQSAPAPSSIVICGKGRIATFALSTTVHYVRSQGLPTRVLAAANADDRGYDGWQPSLVRAAAQLDVECVAVADVIGEPDLVLVSLEYDRLIKVREFASRRLYNVHFSRLPQYRGVYTSIWPLLNGESCVGVTLHFMDDGADTGPVIAQRVFPVPAYLTARQLYDRYNDEGLELFREWLPRLLTGIPDSTAQAESGASVYTRRSLDLRSVEIDLSWPAVRVERFVRAMAFPEYQLPTLGGRAVRACSILPGATDASPGSVMHASPYSTSFAAGDGRIVELVWA